MIKIHPDNCRCRKCKEENEFKNKEMRVLSFMVVFTILIIILISYLL